MTVSVFLWFALARVISRAATSAVRFVLYILALAPAVIGGIILAFVACAAGSH